MSDVVIHTDRGAFKVPQKVLDGYSVEEAEVSGFEADPFGGVTADSLRSEEYAIQAGSEPIVTAGSKLVLSVETKIIKTPAR